MTSLTPAWPWVWALHRRRTPRHWGGCPVCTDHMTSPAPGGGPHQPRDHCCCGDPDDGDLHWDPVLRCSPAEGGTWCGQCWPPVQLSSRASDVRHSWPTDKTLEKSWEIFCTKLKFSDFNLTINAMFAQLIQAITHHTVIIFFRSKTSRTVKTFKQKRLPDPDLVLFSFAANVFHYEHGQIHLFLAVLFPKFEIIGY